VDNAKHALEKAKEFIRGNPHLPVKNLQLTLDYYRDKLGFSEEWTFGATDCGISRNSLRVIFGEDPELTQDFNNKRHRLPIMWFVNNIEEIFQEFKERNIELADDLRSHPYGLREFAFIDINGYYIRIAEATEEE
jgi:hypothetical protein